MLDGGRRLAPELALLPIGAYDPPTGRDVHMNPEEAVRAFLDLGARRMVPMHYGTFRLSYEPLHEPPARLLACAQHHGVAERISVDERLRALGIEPADSQANFCWFHLG